MNPGERLLAVAAEVFAEQGGSFPWPTSSPWAGEITAAIICLPVLLSG